MHDKVKDCKLVEESEKIFNIALERLKQNYRNYTFFAERDVVWKTQLTLIELIKGRNLPLKVFNSYPIKLKKGKRSRTPDIAIVDEQGEVFLVAEFKYEPDHQRAYKPQNLKHKEEKNSASRRNIWHTKLEPSVVDWQAVKKDRKRLNNFVKRGNTEVGVLVFIDEGGKYAHKPPLKGAMWEEWGKKTRALICGLRKR